MTVSPTSPDNTTQRWSSRAVFLLVAVGASVGLGNIWRFPYIAGENGGGAFLLVYLASAVLIILPLLMAELVIGRRGGRSAMGSVRNVAREAGASAWWTTIGWVGMIVVFFVMSYYSVIAGWFVAYVPVSLLGGFEAMDGSASRDHLGALLADVERMGLWHTAFAAVAIVVVARGLHKGIEVAARYLMPLFFLMLLAVVAFGWLHGGIGRGLSFLFGLRFADISAGVVIEAVGQAFFSIGVGTTTMIALGAYLTPETEIPRAATVVALGDTAVALLAGLAIFPLVFAFGLDPASGPELMFETLPAAFAQIPFGRYFGTMFFALAAVAAMTSQIPMLEVCVRWCEDQFGWRRPISAVGVGTLAWALGWLSLLSFNRLEGFRPLGGIPMFEERTIFGLIDFFTANVLLPAGGLLLALFAGWVLDAGMMRKELGIQSDALFALWRFLVRFFAPVCLGAVLLYLSIYQPLWG